MLVALGMAGCAAGPREAAASGRPDGPPGAESRTAEIDGDDGVLPDRVSPFDADVPALTNLDPALLMAVQQAAADAREQGVDLGVTTGWRSAQYQQQLFDEAVDSYGEEEARRRVASPATSRHVTGEAVDIGPTDADSWLSQHGADYGLCQTYANEIWHFELVTSPGGECPEMRADASAG